MAQNVLVPSIHCTAPDLAPGAQGVARVAVDDANKKLTVIFLAPITASQAEYLGSPLSYTLTGGQRLFPRILSATLPVPTSPPGSDSQSVVLTLDGLGDFSIYTLTVNGPDIDPFFSGAKLRFRLACEHPFDCATPATQSAPQPELPVTIDYLTKDYAGFRQALLDFIPTRLPVWTEQNEADLGMMLLELFSATADNLSYMQDRVANEAFLETATQRRSVAGHLALIGYQMDDGASAYTWLEFQVNGPASLPAGFKVSNNPSASDDPVLVFETSSDAQLLPANNQMALYDWGNSNCCLPQSALNAVMLGNFNSLKAGDYLIFDAGREHRDVVRLTSDPQIVSAAEVGSPPVGSPPASPPGNVVVTVVNWSAATPLSKDYYVKDTVVYGNVVVATHGESVQGEALRNLTEQQITELQAEIGARPPGARVPRQRLPLTYAPLAHLDASTLALAATPGSTVAPASNGSFTTRPPRSISTLKVTVDGNLWHEKTSLLESGPNDPVFRVEIDDLGEATVVFGDDVFGMRPAETSTVIATYRVGGGSIGNVGADSLTLARPDGDAPWLNSVSNPLPAIGGRDLESRDHARRVAPPSFHQPMMAVSAADYRTAIASFLGSNGQPAIQRANANFLWTGSWLTVTVTVDPTGTEGLTADLRQQLADYLNSKRLSGYDLEISGPVYLPVDLALQVSVAAGAQQSDVQQALLLAFSTGTLADGSRAFFHPDNFTFGDNLYISQIYAAAMAVPGVRSVKISQLSRAYAAEPIPESNLNLSQGYLAAGSDQVIRLDNDRNFPENGTLTITPTGGQA